MAPMVAVTAAAASGLPANVEECNSGSAIERREQLRGRDDAADWHHAAAEDLARQQHVRGDAGEVSAPPGAELAHTGLDLIKDHHGAGLGARLPDLPQEAVGWQPDAPLGLDGLQQHHRPGCQRGPQGGGIAERHEVNHWQQQRADGTRQEGRPVTDNAPSVLPWNPPCMAIT